MQREELCILTNMCMIYNDNQILVQDRKNPDWPGMTFPGGHVEREESFVDSVIREVKEETGLSISDVRLCGLKQFMEEDETSIKRYIVFLYKTNHYSGNLTSSSEGDVFQIRKDELSSYQLAEGFLETLEVFENDHLSESYIYLENEQWKVKNQ